MATHSSVLAWRIPGTGSLVGCHLWGRTESDTTEVTQQQQQQHDQCGEFYDASILTDFKELYHITDLKAFILSKYVHANTQGANWNQMQIVNPENTGETRMTSKIS